MTSRDFTGPQATTKEKLLRKKEVVDNEVKRIVAAAEVEGDKTVQRNIFGSLTVCSLLDMCIKLEKEGKPVTHLIVDAYTFSYIRTWDELEHKLDTHWRAAGWYGTLWTIKLYVREFDKPHRAFIGSLIEGMPDSGMRFTLVEGS